MYKFLYLLIFCFLPISLFSQAKKNKIFIPNFEVSANLGSPIQKKAIGIVVGTITKYFYESYDVIDEDLANIILKTTVKAQKIGCTVLSEKCVILYIDALDADFRISGNLAQEGNKIRLDFKLYSVKDGKARVESTATEIAYPFQLDFYLSEMTRALLDKKYKIETAKAPQFAESMTDPGSIQVGEISSLDAKLVDFYTTDELASQIVNDYKPLLKKADLSYSEKDYAKAIRLYNSIKTSFTSLQSSTLSKLSTFVGGIENRLDNAYANLYLIKLKKIDVKVEPSLKNTLTEKDLSGLATLYIQLNNEFLNDYPLPQTNSYKVIKGLQERINSLMIAMFSLQEKRADSLAEQYKFTESVSLLRKVQNRGKIFLFSFKDVDTFRTRIQNKIDTYTTNGQRFYKNRITSLVNLAERKNFLYINLVRSGEEKEKDTQDAKSIAENSMRQAEIYIKEGENLLDYQDVATYNVVLENIQFNLQKMGKEFRGTKYDTSFLQAKANIRTAIDRGEDSYTSINGLIFRKHQRKDGKIIYISDVLEEKDNYRCNDCLKEEGLFSWYSAKKRAENLNKKENCEDCYRLPRYSDFKNFIPFKKNENYSRSYNRNDEKEYIPDTNYYWAEYWTFAPGGMIFGNLDLGCYTIDYIFDILFNPLNWRSYIYPISPSTLRYTGEEWKEEHLRLSRGGNWSFTFLWGLPLPYTRFIDIIDTKIRLIREVD